METRVRKVVDKGPVTVDKVYESEFQKEGTKSAQLRQIVTTDAFYPSKQIANSHQDNVFSLDEFGFEEQKFTNVEKRVAWIDIPAAITSPDDVLAKIPAESCLYKVLSNRPIITDSQQYAIDSPTVDLTLESVANKQIVRFGEEAENAGQIVPDENGKPQYRAIFFSKAAKQDQDMRTEDANDYYVSALIRAEMTGATVIQEQGL